MKKIDPNARVCLLLAGSDLTSREIRQFLSWVQSTSPDAIEGIITNLRAEAARAITQGIESTTATVRKRSHRSMDPAEQVEKILRKGTGLTDEEAAEKLIEQLETLSGRKDLPAPTSVSKSGLHIWIESLAQHVSYREILQAAAQVNTQILGLSSHWPLQDRA